MSVKAKGINAERELVHKFWSNEWGAIRVAGSGSTKYPSPDIIASNSNRQLAIEAKITKDKYRHFAAREINELQQFSDKFNAEPWIAIKFKGNDWFFLRIADLTLTGENYSVSEDLAKNKGLSFDSLINAL